MSKDLQVHLHSKNTAKTKMAQVEFCCFQFLIQPKNRIRQILLLYRTSYRTTKNNNVTCSVSCNVPCNVPYNVSSNVPYIISNAVALLINI